MSRWSSRGDVPRGGAYDQRWKDLEAAGESIHGEADLIESFGPATVLDAGCGTGRVAIELARRGLRVVGVDLDKAMLAEARAKAPALDWRSGDLSLLDLSPDDGLARFDVVALPGNVMIFLTPGTEGVVVERCVDHLAPGGRLIAGFQLGAGRLDLDAYDRFCASAGVVLEHRWSTWDRQPFDGGAYAVSVHRLV